MTAVERRIKRAERRGLCGESEGRKCAGMVGAREKDEAVCVKGKGTERKGSKTFLRVVVSDCLVGRRLCLLEACCCI